MARLLDRLNRKERTGSKPRCHWLTHGVPGQVAGRLNALAEPWGYVSADDFWMPEGFRRIEEGQLDKAANLLPKQDRDELRRWWLAVSRSSARTPHWDIACTCTLNGRRGLLLVEAKAHTEGLKIEDHVMARGLNRERIAQCIGEANVSLANQTELHWTLSHEHRYQMANRFVWSWRLTQLGYPVILVYLGFLKTEEMQTPLNDHAEWESLVKSYSHPLFPTEVWHRPLVVGMGDAWLLEVDADREFDVVLVQERLEQHLDQLPRSRPSCGS